MAGHQFYAEWSEADGEFVGRVNEYPSLSWLDPNVIVALQGIRDLVAEVEADMEVERQKALEVGYEKLARERAEFEAHHLKIREDHREESRQRGELAEAIRRTETERQAERELRQAAAGYQPVPWWLDDEPKPVGRGAQKWAGERFNTQDWIVLAVIALAVIAIIFWPMS